MDTIGKTYSNDFIIYLQHKIYKSLVTPIPMTKRIGGFRRKTKHKLSKSSREKGKLSLRNYFQAFKTGDRVYLVGEASVHEGMYFPRFYGRAGKVVGKQGNCYYVEIHDGSIAKKLIVHPIHLKKA